MFALFVLRGFRNIHVCVYIHVFPAKLAVQNVVDLFVSTYHELVDTTCSYLLLA